MIGYALALAGALALELASAWQLARIFAGAAAPWQFALPHLAGAALAAAALFGLLPEHYQGNTRTNFLFLFTVALAVPLLGVLGLGLGLLPALWHQRHTDPILDLIRCKLARPLPSSAAGMSTPQESADGCLMGTLLAAPEREQRLCALIATLSLDVRRALPLLRIGLRDADDDVRLLSYALLSRKEKALETRITTALRRLDQVPQPERFTAHRALARDYAELAELAGDGAARFLLERAQDHALAASSCKPREADVQFLLGRILLGRRDLQAARAAFLRAVAGGIAIDKAALFLAEIAFHRRQLDQVGHLVGTTNRPARLQLARRVAAYWGACRER